LSVVFFSINFSFLDMWLLKIMNNAHTIYILPRASEHVKKILICSDREKFFFEIWLTCLFHVVSGLKTSPKRNVECVMSSLVA
jgi:hypothetical protein